MIKFNRWFCSKNEANTYVYHVNHQEKHHKNKTKNVNGM